MIVSFSFLVITFVLLVKHKPHLIDSELIVFLGKLPVIKKFVPKKKNLFKEAETEVII